LDELHLYAKLKNLKREVSSDIKDSGIHLDRPQAFYRAPAPPPLILKLGQCNRCYSTMPSKAISIMPPKLRPQCRAAQLFRGVSPLTHNITPTLSSSFRRKRVNPKVLWLQAKKFISWLHPYSTSNVILNMCTHHS
jgi:hypothetical protein